jgi:hypothetical protein
MKKISGLILPLAVSILVFSSCSVFKPSPTAVTQLNTVELFAWQNKPLSDKLPNTQLKLKDKTFQLTLVSDIKGNDKVVYLPQDMYDSLNNELPQNANIRPGAYVKGFQISAQTLGSGSIFTEKEMRRLSTEQRRIAEAYQTTEKFIVWNQKLMPRVGITTKDYKIVPVESITTVPVQQNQTQKQKSTDW